MGAIKHALKKTPAPVTPKKQPDTCLGCGVFLDLPCLILEVCCIRIFPLMKISFLNNAEDKKESKSLATCPVRNTRPGFTVT